MPRMFMSGGADHVGQGLEPVCGRAAMRHPVRPTVDWSTAGWGASGPMGAGQPTDGGVAPMREPSALHDGRGWGGAHLQPWPGVDDGGRQAHSDAIVVDGMCGRFGAMGCPPRRAATRRLTGAMIPAPHAARSVPMGCWVRPCGRDGGGVSTDNWNRGKRLGYLFEARVGRGRFLMTTLRLLEGYPSHPEAVYLLDALLHYAIAPTSEPDVELTLAQLWSIPRFPASWPTP